MLCKVILHPLRLPKKFVKSSQTLQVVQGESHKCQPRIPDNSQVRLFVLWARQTEQKETRILALKFGGTSFTQAEVTVHQLQHQRETMPQIPFLSSDNVVLTLLQDFFAFRINGGCIWLRQSIRQNLHYAPGYLEETKQEKKSSWQKWKLYFWASW